MDKKKKEIVKKLNEIPGAIFIREEDDTFCISLYRKNKEVAEEIEKLGIEVDLDDTCIFKNRNGAATFNYFAYGDFCEKLFERIISDDEVLKKEGDVFYIEGDEVTLLGELEELEKFDHDVTTYFKGFLVKLDEEIADAI